MNVQEITKNSVPKMNVFFYTHQEEDTQLVNLQQMRDMYEKVRKLLETHIYFFKFQNDTTIHFREK